MWWRGSFPRSCVRVVVRHPPMHRSIVDGVLRRGNRISISTQLHTYLPASTHGAFKLHGCDRWPWLSFSSVLAFLLFSKMSHSFFPSLCFFFKLSFLLLPFPFLSSLHPAIQSPHRIPHCALTIVLSTSRPVQARLALGCRRVARRMLRGGTLLVCDG